MGTGSLNQLVLDKENAGYRIFEAVDSNPFGFKSGLALSLSLSLSQLLLTQKTLRIQARTEKKIGKVTCITILPINDD
jgi:hypothetical protein